MFITLPFQNFIYYKFGPLLSHICYTSMSKIYYICYSITLISYYCLIGRFVKPLYFGASDIGWCYV